MRRPALPVRLTTRTLLPAGAVITIAIFILAAVVVLDGRRDTERQAAQAADNVAAAMAQDIARNIELYDLSVQAVAHGLQFPGILTIDPDLRQMILFDRATNARHLGFINVLNEAGDVTLDSRSKTPRPANFAGRDYFQFHRRDAGDQLYIGRPFLTGPDQPATIPLSRRLSQPDGSFAGVVVGTIRLAYFRELFARVALGPHATIALLRDDGLILMRLPFNQDDLGRTLPQDSPFFTAMTTGMMRIPGSEAGDPTARSYTFRRVGDLPLVISVGLADDDIYKPWEHKALGIMATVAALCLLLLAVIARLGIALTRQAHAEARARQANEAMERFVATSSHELRTPLTSILGYAELLTWGGQLPPELAGYAAAITSAGTHMSHVLKRMLEVPRSTALANPPEPRDTDLDRLVEDCRREVELRAGHRGLRLACKVDPDLPRSARLDPDQVRQILVNLLTNAIKYTDRGAVELRVSRSATQLRFEVADTGPGIPAAKQGRLFTAYDRLDADQGQVEGTGLGLWHVAQLVAGMDGSIRYADNPGGGSIFQVEIPVDAARPAPMPSPEVAPSRSLRILLADDTALNRELACHFLRSAGHTVAEAGDGVDAVRQASDADFDLVLMDIRMPRMNGLEAARQIRSLPPPRGRVPIVAVTANSAEPREETYRKAGIGWHLSKPFTSDELLSMVDTVATDSGRVAMAVAHLAPVPAGQVLPVLDEAVLDQLASRMSADNIEAYLRTLLGRVDDLLTFLAAPDQAGLAELVHEMQGSVGLLGFTALGARLHEYEAAGGSTADTLVSVAEQTRTVLRQRLSALDLDSNAVSVTP